MRLTVFEDETILSRLASVFGGEVQVISALVQGDVEIGRQLRGDCDMVIIEGDAEEAASLCGQIKQCLGDIPVVMMVKKYHPDWNKWVRIDADGYVFLESGDAEIKARIKAIACSCIGR